MSKGRGAARWGRRGLVVAVASLAMLGASAAAAWAAGPTVFVTNFVDETVTPIDAATSTPGTPIPIGGTPFGVAITPNGTTAYVTNEVNNGTVTPIDVQTHTPGTPIPVGSDPVEVAITPDGTTAYVTNDGGGTVTAIDLATNAAEATIPIGTAPFGVAITPDGTTAYVTSDVSNGTVTPIDIQTNTPGTPIPVSSTPIGVAITPDGKTAYVTNSGSGTVTPIDVQSTTPGTPIPIGNGAAGVAVAPSGRTAYVVSQMNGTVTPVDVQTNTPGTPIPVGSNPFAVAITPATPPSAAVTTPGDGATYTQGQVIDAGYRCAEGAGGPGLAPAGAGCSGTVANGEAIDTSTLGPHAFAVTATSRDGKTATRSVSYTVIPPTAAAPPTNPAPPVKVTGPSCPSPSGRLHRGRLGPVALGMTHVQMHRALFAPKRTRNHYFRSCLAGRRGKLRVAYPSARLLKTLSGRQRKRLRGRVVIALTANRRYALNGIRPRTHIGKRERRRLSHAQHIQIGVNTWYFIRGRHRTGVLKAAHGIIGEIGIANRTLTRTHTAQRRLLTERKIRPRHH